MVYYTSVILLARPYLQSSRKPKTEIVTLQHLFDQTEVGRRASAACCEAAVEICSLGAKYRAAFGSFRLSPLTATHCTLSAALVILFVQPAVKDDVSKLSKNDLDGCLQTLRELSISWSPPLMYLRTLNKILSEQQSRAACDVAKASCASCLGMDVSQNGLSQRAHQHELGTGTLNKRIVKQPGGSAVSCHDFQSKDVSGAFSTLGTDIEGASPSSLQPSEQLLLDIGYGYMDFRAFEALSWDDADYDISSFYS